jgi:hypothetical protein
MATVQPDILRRSVTRDEVEANATAGGVMRFWLSPLAGGGLVNLPYQPPAYWTPDRDNVLRAAYRMGGQWAAAVNIAVTKMMVAGYEVSGDVGLRVRRSREMLGASWIDLMTRLGRDYVTADNGAFIEIVRATRAHGSVVIGFVPLSSARCVRTGDPDVPVLYVDRLGSYHELQAHQVADFSDMPDEDFYDVGLCSTSRAWDAIYEDLAVRAYFKEKATGRRPLALNFLTGMGPKQVEQAITSAQEDASRQGRVAFMGAAVVANPNDTQLNLVTIPLASLPDGFDQVAHEELTQIRYANALGLDPVELNPRLIGNRSIGAGAQAQVLDDKQQSKGLIALRQKVLAFFNDTDRWHPLPGGVQFAWAERDYRDQQAQAGLQVMRAQLAGLRIGAGVTTVEEERNLLVDAGDLPQDFLQVDTTSEEILTDEDKADAAMHEAPVQDVAAASAEVVATDLAPAAPAITTREATDAETLVDDAIPDARRIYRRVQRGNPEAAAIADQPAAP